MLEEGLEGNEAPGRHGCFCFDTNNTPRAEDTNPWNGPSHKFEVLIKAIASSGFVPAKGCIRIVSRTVKMYAIESQSAMGTNVLLTNVFVALGSSAVYVSTPIMSKRLG